MIQKLRYKLKLCGVATLVGIGTSAGATFPLVSPVQAETCPDVKIVFARGSGGERWNTDDYLSFKAAIEGKLATTELKYEFEDLDYPAVGVGIDNLGVTLGAFFSGGEAYEFGDSVNVGVKNLMARVNARTCPQTKYVLGGYSQGAMVVSKSLGSLEAEKVIYAATFGDPKIYLPEGEGIIPAACRGDNLSDYRMYVPDCQAYKGLLGAYIPYEPTAWTGKVGTWCNKRDILCSSHMSVSDHMGYVSDNLYEDASRVIYNKIADTFGIENKISSPHDTAFLIDTTYSMEPLIEKFKNEALRLARKTLESGGRVALYEYRDLDDPFLPLKHCDFEDCSLEKFEQELATLRPDGGGDTPESLLSASLQVMNEQNWKLGSTKSLVVLTDADYLAPDRDGVTLEDVVALSKTIDPVNFYIVTTEEFGDAYTELAQKTDGKVVTQFNELELLTNYIIERYDSLPRVEESIESGSRPALTVGRVERSGSELNIWYETDGEETIVIINGVIMGKTNEKRITITNAGDAEILLVPVSGEYRGEAVRVNVNSGRGGIVMTPVMVEPQMTIPKAPNTGRA